MSEHVVSIEQASSQLDELMRLADEGREIVILRENRPAARLVSIGKPAGPREFGKIAA